MTRSLDPMMKELRESLLLMGSQAEEILDKATRAVRERSAGLAEEVARDDVEIDRMDVEVDHQVLRALALQAPVASDLREVVAIKMIATDLERVGDLARNIAKSAARLAEDPAVSLPDLLEHLAYAAQQMLHRALDAFSRADAEIARAVMDADDSLDATEDELVRSALGEAAQAPSRISESVDVILIAKSLERVGDHATNIAEAVILVTEAQNVKHAAKLRERG